MESFRVVKFVYEDFEKALEMSVHFKYLYKVEGIYLDHVIELTKSNKQLVKFKIKQE